MDEKYSAGEDKEVTATLEEDTSGSNEQPLLTIEITQTIGKKKNPAKAGGKSGTSPAKRNRPKPSQDGQKKDTTAAKDGKADKAGSEEKDAGTQEKDPKDKKEGYKAEEDKAPKADKEPESPAEQPKQQSQDAEGSKKNYDDYKDMVADDEFSGENFNEGHPDKSHEDAGEDDEGPKKDPDENEFNRDKSTDDYTGHKDDEESGAEQGEEGEGEGAQNEEGPANPAVAGGEEAGGGRKMPGTIKIAHLKKLLADAKKVPGATPAVQGLDKVIFGVTVWWVGWNIGLVKWSYWYNTTIALIEVAESAGIVDFVDNYLLGNGAAQTAIKPMYQIINDMVNKHQKAQRPQARAGSSESYGYRGQKFATAAERDAARAADMSPEAVAARAARHTSA